jgi:hypothetical protein
MSQNAELQDKALSPKIEGRVVWDRRALFDAR